MPTLPNGYFGSYLIAYVPWLWYRIMDKRLLALAHIDGDLNKVNIYAPKRQQIYARYGRPERLQPVVIEEPQAD